MGTPDRVLSAVQYLKAEGGESMTLGMVAVLLDVAANKEASLRDLEKRLGLPQSTTSRYAAMLGKPHYLPGKKGLGWMDHHQDDADRRQVRMALTSKGEAVVGHMLKLLFGGD